MYRSFVKGMGLLTLLIVAFVGVGVWENSKKSVKISGTYLPLEKELQTTQLMTAKDPGFDLKSLRGKWVVLFFGYTNCPDVCPTAMGFLSGEFRTLPKHIADASTAVFVSVDPERDHLKNLEAYATHFNPSFIGATASKTTLEKFQKELGVFYRQEKPDEQGNYNVSHTGALFLINPDGKNIAIYHSPHLKGSLANDLIKLETNRLNKNS